jgi:ribonucleoside-diphosphate reductase alpha subunit
MVYFIFIQCSNRKSNQQNLGTIKSSNLCTEIIQYTSPDEVSVCNLSSIGLPKFVKDGKFDFIELFNVVKVITRNLNNIIDLNFYPVIEAERSNKKHRPIGIGVQGLQEVFFELKYPFDSKEAALLNKEIFETIYFAALTESNQLAKEFGPYDSYEGSPVSKGILQYDMWNVIPTKRWNWDDLKLNIKKYGVRNSLLLAPMPTASTSQILGNTEGFEPVTSNIYVRRVLSGEFPVINSYLARDLMKLNLWTPYIINLIIKNHGSIQNINEIPKNLKELYKTVWEIKQKTLFDMAADRGAFIDQSQSMNAYIADPTTAKLTSMHFYAWKKGLKTGMYYLRTKPITNPIQFTVDQELLTLKNEKLNDNNLSIKTNLSNIRLNIDSMEDSPSTTILKLKKKWKCNNEENCLMCSS